MVTQQVQPLQESASTSSFVDLVNETGTGNDFATKLATAAGAGAATTVPSLLLSPLTFPPPPPLPQTGLLFLPLKAKFPGNRIEVAQLLAALFPTLILDN